MFFPRILSKTIHKAIQTFPAVVLTGPRQSGKTTLLKNLFPQYTFVSLDNPDVRIRAIEDPLFFLQQHKPPVIIDEIQYVPQLLSYIKTLIDDNRIPGQWIFTGSQNFTLMQNVSESLAGRAAILTLLPFTYSEMIQQSDLVQPFSEWVRLVPNKTKVQKILIDRTLLRGFYPEMVANMAVDRQLWCASYVATYLERDVRNIANIGNLVQFENFIRLCAARTGQILNFSDMARDIGVSVNTVKRWISVLETSYQIYLLYPYYKNIGKRLVKSPKMYFLDTSLATYLMAIHDPDVLINGPSFGHLFETFVIIEFLKRFLNFGELPSMYYLRTRDGLEIDLVIEYGGKLHLFEIKSAMTITSKYAKGLIRMRSELQNLVNTTALISCSNESFDISQDISNFSWQQILSY